jgi:hypothetical protein
MLLVARPGEEWWKRNGRTKRHPATGVRSVPQVSPAQWATPETKSAPARVWVVAEVPGAQRGIRLPLARSPEEAARTVRKPLCNSTS